MSNTTLLWKSFRAVAWAARNSVVDKSREREDGVLALSKALFLMLSERFFYASSGVLHTSVHVRDGAADRASG